MASRGARRRAEHTAFLSGPPVAQDSGALRRVLLGERRPGSSNAVHPVATVDGGASSRPSTASNGRSLRASDSTPSSAQKYVVKVRVLHGIDLHNPCPEPSCQRAFRPTASIAVNGGPAQSCMAARHARNHSIWKPHELLFHVDGNWQQPPTPSAAVANAYVSLQVALSCAVCSCGLEKVDKTVESIPIGDVGELQLPVKPSEDYQVAQFLPVIRRQRRNSQTTLLMAGKVKLRVRVQVEKTAEMQSEIPRRPPLALPANFGEALQLKRKQLKAAVAPEQSADLSGSATSHKQTSHLDPVAAAELMSEIALETASDQIEFNQLEVEERVGEGIHSCVSRGRLRLRNGDGDIRVVAVKEFRHQHASPPCNVLRAFRQEYRILDYCRRQNGQQHIVELLGVTLQPPLTLVLEYFSRGSLAQCLQDEASWDQVSIKQKVAIAVQIARGIAWLHCHHVIHRDIKSHNVLLSEDHAPVVKLGDLGSAIMRSSHEVMVTEQVGSSGYTAPEVFLPQGYDAKVDVWSFGIVLWELASSCPQERNNPFTGLAGDEFVEKARSGCRPQLLHRDQLWVASVLEKCWLFEPEQRPGMDDVVHELEALCTKLERDSTTATRA